MATAACRSSVGVGGRLGAASDTQMVGAQAHMILPIR
jgi:hypothetical protein